MVQKIICSNKYINKFLHLEMSKRSRNLIRLDESDEEDEVTKRGKIDKDKDWQNDCNDSDDSSIESNKENDGIGDNAMAPIDHDLEAISITANLRINTSNKTRSSHPVWDMFGKLEKDGKIIAKAKDRVFCVHCFEKKKMKR